MVSGVSPTPSLVTVPLTFWVWGGDYYVSIPRPFSLQWGVWTYLIRSRSGVGISPFPRIAGRRLRAGPDMDVTTGRRIRRFRYPRDGPRDFGPVC